MSSWVKLNDQVDKKVDKKRVWGGFREEAEKKDDMIHRN